MSHINIIFYHMWLIQFFIFLMIVLSAGDVLADGITHASVRAIAWRECNDKRLDLRFQCGDLWVLQPHDDFLSVRISVFPMVQMLLEKVDVKITFPAEITNHFLIKTQRYQSVFSVESFKSKHYSMTKVKAFDSFNSDIRLTDFYFFKNQALYRLSFRAHPKESWDQYQFIAQYVAWSLE